jgi:hypothetical protein
MTVYFDTVAFRHIGKSFEDVKLPDEIRNRILISPLTVFEVFSQLTIGDKVLRQVHAILNWCNPQHTGLLMWPDDVLSGVWFGKAPPDDGFTERMQKAFNTCLNAESVKELAVESGHLKDEIDNMKTKTANDFGQLLRSARKEGFAWGTFSEMWFQGIANRVKGDPNSRSVSEVASLFNAHHEFERRKLRDALPDVNYDPIAHRNDLFDAEQLVYLSNPYLYFLTSDKGLADYVKNSSQANRVINVQAAELDSAEKVETLLKKMIRIP